jgi:hypothetical protein
MDDSLSIDPSFQQSIDFWSQQVWDLRAKLLHCCPSDEPAPRRRMICAAEQLEKLSRERQFRLAPDEFLELQKD